MPDFIVNIFSELMLYKKEIAFVLAAIMAFCAAGIMILVAISSGAVADLILISGLAFAVLVAVFFGYYP